MNVFKSLIPVLFFIVINSGLSILLKKGFGKVLPLTLISSSFILFVSQLLLGTFKIGIYAIYILFFSSVYFIYKEKDRNKYIFTNGFYLFLCIFAVFAFINFGKHFYWDDELGFWGKMVKEMIRLNKFYYVNESTLRGHNDYPPFISLFELLWSNLTLGYSEPNVTMALQIFEFSIILPFVFDESFEKKKIFEKIIIDLFLTVSFVGIVLYLDADDVFNSIYVDTLIAMEFAYASYLVFTKEVDTLFGSICFGLSLVMIVLTKQVGIAFCLLEVFLYVIYRIANWKDNKNIISLAVLIVLPVLSYLLWNSLIKPYEIVKQFDFSKISVEGLKEVMSGTDYRFEAVKLYINALFKKAIYEYPVPITFVSSVLVEIVLMIILCLKEKTNSILLGLTSIVGSLGYALMMFILYAFCYPEREALILISYNRYMSSFVAALFLSTLLLYVKAYKKLELKINIRNIAITCVVILALFDSNRMLNFVPQVILGNRFTSYEDLANKVKAKMESGDYLYILYDHDIADSYPAFTAYYLDEIFVCKVNTDFNEIEYKNDKEFNEAIKEISQYDYFYVVEASDLFNGYFSKYNSNKDFEKETLYKVSNNGTLKFEKVS